MFYTIALVTNNYYPYRGGVVSSIDAVSKLLEEHGHTVFIITLDFKGDRPQDSQRVIRIACKFNWQYKGNHMAFSWDIEDKLERVIVAIRPDIIHSQHPFYLGQYAQKIAQIYGIPHVFTMHTWYEQYAHYVPLPKRIVKCIIRKKLQNFVKKADMLIAPGKQVQDYLISLSPKTDVHCIPSPIKEIFMHRDKPQKERGSSWHLLYVGRLAQEKNCYALLDLILLLPQTYFLAIVGYGYEKTHLQKKIKQNKRLLEGVVIKDGLSQDQIKDEYSKAHFFVFMSKTDTQGLVLAEAMAGGTPIFALNGPGQENIIDQGKNGFIVSSIDEMAYLIKQLSSDWPRYQKMSSQAFFTAQRYSSAYLGTQWNKSYDSLFENNILNYSLD